jgi:hypothetical protein
MICDYKTTLLLILLTTSMMEMVSSQEPLACPAGWVQRGALGADISGCGLEIRCKFRYGTDTDSVDKCSVKCDSNPECKGFTFAPLGGDQNHDDKTVCTIYGTDQPTGTWGDKQIFCARAECDITSWEKFPMKVYCRKGGEQFPNLGYKDQVDQAECEAFCVENNECAGYLHRHPPHLCKGQCHIRPGKPDKDQKLTPLSCIYGPAGAGYSFYSKPTRRNVEQGDASDSTYYKDPENEQDTASDSSYYKDPQSDNLADQYSMNAQQSLELEF